MSHSRKYLFVTVRVGDLSVWFGVVLVLCVPGPFWCFRLRMFTSDKNHSEKLPTQFLICWWTVFGLIWANTRAVKHLIFFDHNFLRSEWQWWFRIEQRTGCACLSPVSWFWIRVSRVGNTFQKYNGLENQLDHVSSTRIWRHRSPEGSFTVYYVPR